ncbi:ATP-binding cassette domain-containing protein [Patescibacteria group bacterium]|nr:ATP-binding cassette domain-containing protein [Patescibacteria group bacterium]
MIEIRNLSIDLGEFSLKNINLTIGDREYFVILGPTGAGKTIIIECIAGLHRIKQGEIWIDGNNATRLAPEERCTGYVPQDYVLFPFLNVADNIAFGLRQAKYPKTQTVEKVKSLSNLMGISHLLNRDTRSLSGGEKQRVALARALALSPKVLLLDEPLSSLDLQTSKYLRMELRRIHKELGVATLHITHNQMEAEEVADRIGILNMGKLEQVGKPYEVFFHPENEIVSDFIGAPNILNCDSCRTIGHGIAEVTCDGMCIILPHDGGRIQKIALFPRDIYISDVQPPGPQVNRFKGTITNIKSSGTTARIEVRVRENILQAEMPRDIFEDMDLTVGKEAFLILKLRRIRTFEGKNSQ